ncbi:MAG: cytochrome c [Flavobacteriales bacterium]|mgnify:CR=1 FL=1|jgi:mono/diheme cytochrome c family protein|nr:cytochrome c [Flavobacteriales bacterium]HJN63544.1 cytochrome c [Flavobacteriales bacterium]|tara:strand:- start:1024 stop:1608 length:585 start_codon:yes stop_codon:yes gene_type:complete
MNKVFNKLGFFTVVLFFSSCTGGDSSPGYEYMPNMYRSPSQETYGENTINGMNARTPVEGTIARGKLSTFNFDETLDGYLKAGDEAINPIENNAENLADGKELYGMFCEHCHGETGAGGGTVKHALYSVVPHYNDGKLIRRAGVPMNDLKAGHIFHAITYGLNSMGPHASQLSEEERWKITLYVQEELQHYGLE